MTLEPVPVQPDANSEELGQASILVVDDRPDKLLVFKTILEDLGHNVVTVQSGESALRWLLDNECAVMLLDVNMPGMDGFETAQLVRGRRRSAHTPIIFVSANPEDIHSTKGYSLGAVDYLPSPIAPIVLRSKVTVFVQLYNLTRQIRRQADERIALAREQAARTAAESAMRRARFLSEASKVLSGSLDLSSLMVGATRVLVPTLADFSAMTVVEGETMLVRTACKADWNLDESRIAITQDPQWISATNEVIATGQQARIEDFNAKTVAHMLTAEADGSADSARHPWPSQNILMLPLVARDKIHGVIAFGLAPVERQFSEDEMTLATDIASRVAVAVDNCLLFKEIQKGDQRKNEFLATLAHELRNPLAPMRTAMHALHLSGQWPAGSHELREIFDRQLAQLTHLVDDLLDVARITHGKVRLRRVRTDLLVELKDALESTRSAVEAAGHQLSVNVPAGPVLVNGDPVRLQQIIENLVFNACKYTEPHGLVDISLSHLANEAVIRVRDSGIGIAPAMLPKIWDMFTQAEEASDRARQGLGIGLSLVKNLVHLHGGSIQALSEGIGKGSEFVVRLPMLLDACGEAEPPEQVLELQCAAADSPAPARKILVVDDNVDAAESLKLLLAVYGHQVELAHEGVAALQVASAYHPDLIFLDLGLPGMSGYEVARRLREGMAFTKVKIIALTGYGTEDDQLRSKAAGFDRHLVKPIDPSVLPEVIADVFQNNDSEPNSDALCSPGTHA